MKAPRFSLIPLVAVCLVALAAILCIPVLIYVAARAVWFRYKNRGKVFLVYTRRHGWNEFIRNNFIPAFAPHVEAIEYPRGCEPWPAALAHVYAAGRNKPYLAKVSLRGVRYIALHELLLPLKPHGARRADVQRELRQMLAARVGSDGP